jgi:hypothetical protein
VQALSRIGIVLITVTWALLLIGLSRTSQEKDFQSSIGQNSISTPSHATPDPEQIFLKDETALRGGTFSRRNAVSSKSSPLTLKREEHTQIWE